MRTSLAASRERRSAYLQFRARTELVLKVTTSIPGGRRSTAT